MSNQGISDVSWRKKSPITREHFKLKNTRTNQTFSTNLYIFKNQNINSQVSSAKSLNTMCVLRDHILVTGDFKRTTLCWAVKFQGHI